MKPTHSGAMLSKFLFQFFSSLAPETQKRFEFLLLARVNG